MRNGRDLIGMPIVVTDSGEEIERVEGLVLDHSETHISAFLVDSDDWTRQARVLPLHDVESFGTAEIAVSSSNAIHDVVQIPDIRRLLNRDLPLTSTRIIAGDGCEVGTVNDVVFDEDTGGIDAFQFVNGAKTNAFERCALPLYDELEQEVIAHITEIQQLVDEGPEFRWKISSKSRIERATAEKMRGEGSFEQARRFFSTPSEKIHRITTPLGRFFKTLWDGAKCRIRLLFHKAAEAIDNYHIRRAMGHRAKIGILDAEDTVIIHQGETITTAVIDRARAAGVLRDLLCAVDKTAVDVKTQKKRKWSDGWMDDWWPPFV